MLLPFFIAKALIRNFSAQQAQQVWDEFFRIETARPMYHAAARLSISTGIVLSVSMVFGHLDFGKVALIGSLIAGYGFGQSLSRRLRIQIAMAISMTLIVSLGGLTYGKHWLNLVFITLVSTIAAFCCIAFSVGPPGAYLLCLCAGMATNIPFHPMTLYAVISGSGTAICVTIIYSFFVKFRIQKEEFYRARDALYAYIQEVLEGNPDKIHAKRNDSLAALVTNTSLLESTKRQLKRIPERRELFHLNTVLQETAIDFLLHELEIKKQNTEDLQEIAERIKVLEPQKNPRKYVSEDSLTSTRTFIATRTRWYVRIRGSLAIYSFARRTALRVFCACLITGMIVYDNRDIHSYWAVASAVVILHSGPATRLIAAVRSVQRAIGTLVGVLLAAVIITLDLRDVWLIFVVMILQIIIELTGSRNLAFANIFVTPAVMIIITLGEPSHETAWNIITQRSYDTIIGCTVGMIIAVFSTTLLTKDYLWIQLHDLIYRAHLLVTIPIPKRTMRGYSSRPLAQATVYETQVSELLHLRLRLDQMFVLIPCAWGDEGTKLAAQTARDLADLSLIRHTIPNEKTDDGITISAHIEKLYQEYWQEENLEHTLEERQNLQLY